MEEKTKRQNKTCAWLIGIGLVLVAVHNVDQPLLQYVFLPIMGMSLIVPAILLMLCEHRHNITLGSKWVWIPLVIIALSISLSGKPSIFNALFGCVVFGLYLVARISGQQLFKPFAIAVVIESISLVVYGLIYQGDRTGGLVSWSNYDMATGFLVFGLVVSAVKYQWWLSGIALVGLCFTGAQEALVAILVLAAAVLMRRDWSRKLLFPIITLFVTILVSFAYDIPQRLYGQTTNILSSVSAQENSNPSILVEDRELRTPEKKVLEITDKYTFEDKLDYWSNFRYYDLKAVFTDIKPFGHGYIMTEFYEGIPHNVPIIIVHQVGILGGLAWLVVMFYLLIKSKYKYLIVAILALSLFDHFLWTQVGVWWWAAIGVASSNNIVSDLVFKKTPQVEVMTKYRHICQVAKVSCAE